MTTTELHRSVTHLFTAMADAWSRADDDAFAALFTTDADFVEIRGGHHVGRAAIAAGHRGLWASVYAGSVVDYRLESVRPLGPNDGVGIVAAILEVPEGPLAGRHRARITAVVSDRDGAWRIASFHNTLVQEDLAVA